MSESQSYVLLVEDREEDAELTKIALNNHLIYDIIWLKDGQEAVDFLLRQGKYEERTSGHPKVVLLDLKLPKLNGLEVLERTKHYHDDLSELPVVVLTTSKENSDIRKAYNLGANSYIVKPVELQNFAEAVKSVGLYWLVMNE